MVTPFSAAWSDYHGDRRSRLSAPSVARVFFGRSERLGRQSLPPADRSL